MPTTIPPFTNVPAPGDDVKSAWAQQLTQYAVDHVNDITDAHDASAISFVPTGSIAATNVQAAIAEVAVEAGTGAVDLHIADTVDAHGASAISYIPGGVVTATNVQNAIEQAALTGGGGGGVDDHGDLTGLLDDDHPQYAKVADLTAHIADTTAHDAAAIAFAPSGTIVATNVQDAIAAVAAGAGGVDRSVQFNSSGSLAGAGKVEIAPDGNLQLVGNSGFPAGVAGRTKIVDVTIGNRVLPFVIHEHGRPALLPPGGWVHSAIVPTITIPTTPNLTPVGLPAPITTGTARTPPSINGTYAYTAAYRMIEIVVTTPSASAAAGLHSQIELFAIPGSSPYHGGFIGSMRWGAALGGASCRAFCGFNGGGGAFPDVEPSSLVSILGMGWDSADTNVQMMHNDTSGAATKVDLGAGFPVAAAGALYELIIYVPQGVAEVNWMVINHHSGALATGAITTNMMNDGNAMCPRTWMTAGGVSGTVGVGIAGWDFWNVW